MAFFGLTSLGTQNPFHVCQSTPIHVFSKCDYIQAWDKVVPPDQTIQKEDLKEVLRVLYMCPEKVDPPQDVIVAVIQSFKEHPCISRDLYITKMLDISDASSNNEGYFDTACEYSSGEDFRFHLSKHSRGSKGPREKYQGPLTTANELGWIEQTEITQRQAKKSCPETIYASAMVKAGMFF